MERILAKLRIETDEFKNIYTPEQTAMMKRVFDQACHDCNVLPNDADSRESLALVILRATNSQTTEAGLLAVARQVARKY
jgi:hypothetical protein